jgi:phage tail-like protein
MANGQPTPAATGGGVLPVDPYRNYLFKLEIRGVTEGHFTACSGLAVRVRPIRYREGGTGQVVRALPGAADYHDVTLAYGVTRSRDLFNWLLRTVAGDIERRNVSIILLEQNGADEAFRWNLLRSWPSQWRGSPLDALGNNVALEELTLSYESLERV